MEQINAVGRRKAAIARVFVKEGTGVITINKRTLENYFPNPILQYIVKQPLNVVDAVEKYDIKVNLIGGGFTGQAEALRLGIARALVKINPEDKPALRAAGFIRNRVVRKPVRDSSSVNVNFSLCCFGKCLVSKLPRLAGYRCYLAVELCRM
jgi:small subunit ribosomal protein S9